MISVVIPAFNAAATIGEQLAALAVQVDGHDVEVLVADNGSQDATVAIVTGWSERLPISVVNASARRGPAAARNLGAEAASGDLLLFTDADDVVMPGWLDAWVDLERDVAFATGPIVSFAGAAAPPRSADDAAMRAPVHLGFLPFAFGTNLAVRPGVFHELGGFPEDRITGEDVVLSWRLQLAGHELCFLPGAGVARRTMVGARALFRQHYAYGRSDPFLVRDFRGQGLRRPPAAPTFKTYLGLLARLPRLYDPVPRARWCTQAGRRAGRIVGSLRARTLCL